jgi:RimJ/RimL family protein N-acetyltransferase
MTAARVVLRPLRPDDAPTIVAYRSDPEVARYQSWAPTLDDVLGTIDAPGARAPFAPGTWTQLGIALHASGELIGDVGVHVFEGEPLQAEFGITLATAFQGRGYATEALRALLALLFDDLGKHRVTASVDPRNARSIALMRRAGFRQEGHLVESLRFKGAWADDLVFAMLAREWQHHRASR